MERKTDFELHNYSTVKGTAKAQVSGDEEPGVDNPAVPLTRKLDVSARPLAGLSGLKSRAHKV